MASPEIIVPKLGSFNVPIRLSPLQIDTSICPPGSINPIDTPWYLEPTISGHQSRPGTRGAFGLWALFTAINQFGGEIPGTAAGNDLPVQFLHWYLDETGIFSLDAMLDIPNKYSAYGNYSPYSMIHGPGVIYSYSQSSDFVSYNEFIPTAYCDIILLKNKKSKISGSVVSRYDNLGGNFIEVPLVMLDYFGRPAFFCSNAFYGQGTSYGFETLASLAKSPYLPPGVFGVNVKNVYPLINVGPSATLMGVFYPPVGDYELSCMITDPYSGNCLYQPTTGNQWETINSFVPWNGNEFEFLPTSVALHLYNNNDDNSFQTNCFGTPCFAVPGGGFGIKIPNENRIFLIDPLFRGYYTYELHPSGNATSALAGSAGMDWNGNIWTAYSDGTLFSSVGTHQISPLLLFGSGAGLNLSSQVAFSECIPSLQRKRLW